MTDAVRDMVTGLTAEGWLTVAPHLYHRDDADELGEDDGDRVDAQVGRLESGAVMADTDTAFGWLADHKITADRMGVLGFDVGAVVALLVATGGPWAPRCRWPTRPGWSRPASASRRCPAPPPA